MAKTAPRICKECGIIFQPHDVRTMICSKECYIEHRSTTGIVLTCIMCGQRFRAKRRTALYCSPRCRVECHNKYLKGKTPQEANEIKKYLRQSASNLPTQPTEGSVISQDYISQWNEQFGAYGRKAFKYSFYNDTDETKFERAFIGDGEDMEDTFYETV